MDGRRQGPDRGDARAVAVLEPVNAALVGAARLFRPVLAAAAFVLLLLIVPGREQHPVLEVAEAYLTDALDAPVAWLHWSLQRDPPTAEAVILQLAESKP